MKSKLAQLRIALCMTQAELAQKAGISTNFLALIEQGHRKASVAVAKKIADRLGISLQSLIEITSLDIELVREILRKEKSK